MVNRFTSIAINEDHINRIDAMGKEEEQKNTTVELNSVTIMVMLQY